MGRRSILRAAVQSNGPGPKSRPAYTKNDPHVEATHEESILLVAAALQHEARFRFLMTRIREASEARGGWKTADSKAWGGHASRRNILNRRRSAGSIAIGRFFRGVPASALMNAC